MAMTMHINIVSAEAEIFSGTANMIFAPGEMGELGIAPRHTPLLTRLKAGEVRVQVEGKDEEAFYVSGGMLEIQPHIVTVLADTAIRAKDLDEAAAIKAQQRAEKAMVDRKSDFDYAQAQAEFAEASAQLRAIKKLRDHATR